MSSFYGGKQGRTYNIIERFDAVYFDPEDTTGFIEFDPSITENSETKIKNGPVPQGTKLFYGQTRYFVLQDISDISVNTFSDSSLVDEMRGMVNEFQKGGAYNRVNYGEYVLIDTVKTTGRSNNENGLLFRRGFNYSEQPAKKPNKNNFKKEDGESLNQQAWQSAWSAWVEKPGAGAIYVGQIIGPEGRTPELEIKSLSWLEEQARKHAQDSTFGELHTLTLDSTPGININQDSTITYHNKITSGYVNILDSNGEVIKGYIAFDIPYTITKVSAQSVNPYKQTLDHTDFASGKIQSWTVEEKTGPNGQRLGIYENLIHLHPQSGPSTQQYKDKEGNIIEPASHPYYYDYQIAIPAGKHGADLNKIDIQTGKQIAGNQIGFFKTQDSLIQQGKNYYIKQINEQQQEQYVLVPQQERNNQNIQNYYEQLVEDDKYLTYSIKDYTGSAAGAITEHLGRWPWRVIKDIATNFKNRVLYDLEYSIENCKLGDLASLPGSDQTQFYAICIQEGMHLAIDTDNIDTSLYVEGYIFPANAESGIAQWQVIRNNDTSTQDGVNGPPRGFTVDFTAGESSTFSNFAIVDYVFMDTKGNLYVNYSNDETYNQNGHIHDTLHLIGTITSINDIIYNDGKFNVIYNTGNVKEIPFRQIQKIEYTNQKDITQVQQIKATYDYYHQVDNEIKTEQETVLLDNINRVLAIDKYGDSAIVLYSDPAVRAKLQEEQPSKIVIKDWTDPLDSTIIYQDLVWYKLGPIGAQYHILGQVTLQQLKQEYKNGIPENTSREGWLVTYNDENTGMKYIFAYDYLDDQNSEGKYQLPDGTPTHWYEVMSASESLQPSPEKYIIVKDSLSPNEENSLKQDGIWLVVSQRHDH